MKHLPKHLQPRYRYLAVRIESWPDVAIGRSAFESAIREAATELYGDVGDAETDLSVVRFRFEAGAGDAIVRTRRGQTDRARAAVAYVSAINGAPIGLYVAGISGTVRACSEKYIGERPEFPSERNVVFGSAQRTAWCREDRVDIRTDGAFTGATNLDLE